MMIQRCDPYATWRDYRRGILEESRVIRLLRRLSRWLVFMISKATLPQRTILVFEVRARLHERREACRQDILIRRVTGEICSIVSGSILTTTAIFLAVIAWQSPLWEPSAKD